MEGLPQLHQALEKEWALGLGCLPASEFSRLLSQSLTDILKQSEESQKLWFLTVRQGPILHDLQNLFDDKFAK